MEREESDQEGMRSRVVEGMVERVDEIAHRMDFSRVGWRKGGETKEVPVQRVLKQSEREPKRQSRWWEEK